MSSDFQAALQQEAAQLIAWRRFFHQHPELSFQEYETAAYIERQLLSFGGSLQVSRPTATSVVASLVGETPGETILFRADIDALPIQEENTVAYKSENAHVMHACGHDGHMAILLTVAKILLQSRQRIKGTILFVFQAAEEVGGAPTLLQTGLLEPVDKAFALHLWSPLAVGKFGIASGPIMAASVAFDVKIHGVGGHAAKPEETIDPIQTALAIVASLQTSVSHQIPATSPHVVTVTYFHGGTNNNVISDHVTFGGTIRSLDRRILQQIKAKITKAVKSGAALYGADATLVFETDLDAGKEKEVFPVINNPTTTQLVFTAVKKQFGAERIEEVSPTLVAEDFSFYGQQVPATFVFVGTRNEKKGSHYPHHHPRFNLDEDSLKDGVGLFLSIAQELSFVEE